MYPPPSSSSSSQGQGQGESSNLRTGGLNRYDSAPGSFLAAVDSVIGQARSKQVSPLAYFSSSSSSSSSETTMNGLHQRSFGSSSSNSAPLIRHSSLPAAFLNRVPSSADHNGTFSSFFSPRLYIQL